VKLKMRFFQNRYVENKNEQFEMKNGLQFQAVALHVFIWFSKNWYIDKHKQPDSWSSTPDVTYKINKISRFS
jgi:hypothetical protein